MKGYFKPKYPKKYMGNPKGIVYRSSWEFKYMMQLDHDNKVLRWASEEFAIKYLSPKDKKFHRYFPDFFVEYKDGRKELIEVKPYAQCIPPKPHKNRRRLLNEIMTYEVNQSKWAYASEWCKQQNVTFKVLTEKQLFPKITKKKR